MQKVGWNLVFVIDNSGSSFGKDIAAYNNAVREILCSFGDVDGIGDYFDAEISTLVLSDKARWIQPMHVKISDFRWNDLIADGIGDYSTGFQLLDKSLSIGGKDSLLTASSLVPLIIFMSDGCPVSADFKKSMMGLENNVYFRQSVRVVFQNGYLSKKSKDFLMGFCGEEENILNSSTLIPFVKSLRPHKFEKQDSSEPDTLKGTENIIW